MIDISVSIPETILNTLREKNYEFANNMKKYTALKLYETNKLSLGQSAELAEMSEEDFIKFLSENNISIFSYMTKDILEKDVQNA